MLIALTIRVGANVKITGMPALLAMIIFFLVWVVGDLIETNSSTFAWILLGRNIEQIGVFFTPLCALYFSIDYSANRKIRVFAYLMSAVQTVSVFLIFTDQYHHIMRKSVDLQRNSTFGTALIVHSTSIGSLLVAFNFCLPLVAIAILVLFASTVSAKLRRPLWLIIISIFLTVLAATLQSTILTSAGINIPIPVLNLPCIVLLCFAVLRSKFIGIAPTALHKVFEVIDQGIIVLDSNGMVTEYNGRALELARNVMCLNSLQIGSYIPELFCGIQIHSEKRCFSIDDLPKELSNSERSICISLTAHTLKKSAGSPMGYVLVLTDISILKERAEVDPLTSVYNREGLNNAFLYFKEHSKSNACLSAMVIDLDKFKNINDTYGHLGGDSVLKDFVHTAKSVLPENCALGRLGGDEFVVLLFAGIEETFDVAENLRKTVRVKSVQYLNHKIQYTISIGVASSNIQDGSLPELLDIADKALYRAKQTGRNTCNKI
jgi:diguanylate cyclase (GGDEF) domain